MADFERKFDDMPPGKWEILANPDEESNGYFRIAGTSYHFRECASVLKKAPFELHFERDPHNRHDPNAIKIMSGSLHLGFVGKSNAGEIVRNPDFPLMKPVLRSVWRGKFDDGTEAISIEYAILIPARRKTAKLAEICFYCPECGQLHKADAIYAGFEFECIKCGKSFFAPTINGEQKITHNQKKANSSEATGTTSSCYRFMYIKLGLIFGLLGIHDFYAGYWLKGILKLLMLYVAVQWGLIILVVISYLWTLFEIIFFRKDAKERRMK